MLEKNLMLGGQRRLKEIMYGVGQWSGKGEEKVLGVSE